MTDDLLQILLVGDHGGDVRLLQEMLKTVDVPFGLSLAVRFREARQHPERARPGIVWAGTTFATICAANGRAVSDGGRR